MAVSKTTVQMPPPFRTIIVVVIRGREYSDPRLDVVIAAAADHLSGEVKTTSTYSRNRVDMRAQRRPNSDCSMCS